MHRTLVALVAAATLCMSGIVASAEEEKAPDATLQLSGGSVAAGIGFSWGSGTLTYSPTTERTIRSR